jgi:hypothetical protein
MLTTTCSFVCCYGPVVAVPVYLASAATNEMALVFCLEENVDRAMQAHHAMTAWLALHSERLSHRKFTLVARLFPLFFLLTVVCWLARFDDQSAFDKASGWLWCQIVVEDISCLFRSYNANSTRKSKTQNASSRVSPTTDGRWNTRSVWVSIPNSWSSTSFLFVCTLEIPK